MLLKTNHRKRITQTVRLAEHEWIERDVVAWLRVRLRCTVARHRVFERGRVAHSCAMSVQLREKGTML